MAAVADTVAGDAGLEGHRHHIDHDLGLGDVVRSRRGVVDIQVNGAAARMISDTPTSLIKVTIADRDEPVVRLGLLEEVRNEIRRALAGANYKYLVHVSVSRCGEAT